MVYSTCTVRKAENEEVCERLLREHPELEPVELPEIMGIEVSAQCDSVADVRLRRRILRCKIQKNKIRQRR